MKKYNLTYPQKNIWLVEKFNENTPINLIVGTVEINEEFNELLCEEAINHVIASNDAMRLILFNDNGNPIQEVTPYLYQKFEVVDMSLYSDSQKSEYINDWILRPLFFDKCGKLFQFCILKYNDTQGAILMKVHHIIADAWSCGQIGSQLIAYMEQTEIEKNQEKRPSYLEYIQSEKEYEASEKYVKDEEFWHTYLEDIKEQISLKEKAITTSTCAKRYHTTLDQTFNDDLLQYCKENKLSPYAVFLAAITTYLYRVKDKDDFILGTPVLNRSNFREKQMLGMFVSTIPIRMKITENMSFLELSKQIASDTLHIFRHQKYPYSKTIEHIHQTTDIKDNLYNIVVSYQNAKTKIENDQKYSTTWKFVNHISDQLQIHIMDMDGTGVLNINYDYLTDVFTKEEIAYLHTRLIALMNHAINDVEVNVEDIRIMSEQEEHRILYEFNNTETIYPKDKTVIALFEEQVEKTPDAIALEFEEIKVTYFELNERVNNIASKVQEYYIENSTLSKNIGIFISRKLPTIEMILAVLKIGGTFVPIDMTYPKERIEHIIKIGRIDICLFDYIDRPAFDLDVIYINNTKLDNPQKIISNGKVSDNLYLIFTSGSTGVPKGVAITNRNIVNLLYSQKNRNLIFENKTVLQFATMCFDVSYQEIFSTLCFGSKLVLLGDHIKKDSVKLSRYIAAKKIDILFIPPAYLRYLCENNSNIQHLVSTLSDVIVAGEQLIVTKGIEELLKLGNIHLHNHYGPAETHVVTTITLDVKQIRKYKKIPIGKPIDNTKVLVLDKKRRLLPIGLNGQICMMGDAVGNGYINNPETTKKAFVSNPFSREGSLYQSGDIGLMDDTGVVYFNGRMDFQVKVNGFRIEVEEIEKSISKLSYINNVIVKINKNEDQKNILIAIVELNEFVTLEKLKKGILKYLPQYMVPNLFYKIDKMPLNRNGKIDRKLIDVIKLDAIEEEHTSTSIKELKKTTTNMNIIKCLEKTLNFAIKSNINFFNNGMDSLQAIKFQTELMKYDIMVSIQDIYDNPTLYKLSAFINRGEDHQLLEQKVMTKTVNNPKPYVKKIKNIVLTGATGFLGIHVLEKLLETESDIKIICLTRKYPKNMSSVNRIRNNISFYFGKDKIEKYMSKIEVYESDLSLEKFGLEQVIYEELRQRTDAIINCAAIVSHYARRKDVRKSNYQSIKNLVDFVMGTDIVLNHISTIGVCGNGLVKNNNCIKLEFTEDDLYVGQEYNKNIYVSSKILGENILYKNMNKIKANIIRVGNLTNRYSDGKFQKNYNKNAFQNKIGALFTLGCVTENLLENEYDITPVDICASDIVKIVTLNSYNGVYHLFNPNVFKFKDIIKYMERSNMIKIDIVSIDKFKEKLFNIDDKRKISTLYEDMLIEGSNCVKVKNDITQLRGLSSSYQLNHSYYTNMFQQLWRNSNE